MVYWLRESPADPGEVEREASRIRFTVDPAPPEEAPPAGAPPAT